MVSWFSGWYWLYQMSLSQSESTILWKYIKHKVESRNLGWHCSMLQFQIGYFFLLISPHFKYALQWSTESVPTVSIVCLLGEQANVERKLKAAATTDTSNTEDWGPFIIMINDVCLNLSSEQVFMFSLRVKNHPYFFCISFHPSVYPCKSIFWTR